MITRLPREWTYYLAGPVTGHEDFNREAFADAERRMQVAGFTVRSPRALFPRLDEMERAWTSYAKEALKLHAAVGGATAQVADTGRA